MDPYILQNITLRPLLYHILTVATQFKDIYFVHVRGKFNKIVNKLFKKFVLCPLGMLQTEDHED